MFDAKEYRRRRQNLRASERLDVLEPEEDLPRGTCMAPGCNRGGLFSAWHGTFGIRYLCPRCRGKYRTHDEILARIRSL